MPTTITETIDTTIPLWGVICILAIAFNQYARGVKYYTATIPPPTSSTDNWATVANQTLNPNNTIRVNYNNWMRDGFPIAYSTLLAAAVGSTGANIIRIGNPRHPISGYFEIADTVESGRDSGKWISNGTAFYYTGDGLHGTSNSYPLMAAAVDVTKFNV
jgi:hypothetical protein